MTKRTCLSCGTVFEDTFSFTTCSTCKQTQAITRAMANQSKQNNKDRLYSAAELMEMYGYSGGNYSPPPVNTQYDDYVYTPPEPVTQEEKKMHYYLTHKLKVLEVLLWTSPLTVLPLLWFITSGWFTFFAFVAFPFAWIGAAKWLEFWRMSNSYYLYSIKTRVFYTP